MTGRSTVWTRFRHIDFQVLTALHLSSDTLAHQQRKAQINGVAVKNPCKGFGHHCPCSHVKQGNGCMLPAGSAPEISAPHNDSSLWKFSGNPLFHAFQAVAADFLRIGKGQVTARINLVRVNVISQSQGLACKFFLHYLTPLSRLLLFPVSLPAPDFRRTDRSDIRSAQTWPQ